MKAIIVGAGVGGLATAVALERAEIEARIYERRHEAADVEAGTGLTMWPNAMVSLGKLGLRDQIEAEGSSLTWLEQRTARWRELRRFNLGQIAQRSGIPIVNVTRAHLTTVLRNTLADDTVVLGHKCVGFRQRQDLAIAQFDGTESEAEGDLLVGADGIFSAVRAQLLGPADPRYAGYTAWRGLVEFEHERAPRHTFMQLIGRGQRFFWYWVNDRQIYWLAVTNAPPGQADTPGRATDEIGERFRDWPEPVGAMIAATDDAAILRTDVHDRPPVPRWGEARVTLLGDAAHAMTFNVGQGACQAIDGAVILAGELSQAASVEAALRSYETQRIERTSGLIERAWRQGKILQWHNPIACAFRQRFFVRLVGGGGFLA